MENSNKKYEVPFARRRYHPQFRGMRRYNSALSAQETTDVVANSNLSSIPNVWDLESKQSDPHTNNGAMESENVSQNPELDVGEDLSKTGKYYSKFSSSMRMSLSSNLPYNLEAEKKKRNTGLHKIPSPRSVASYYYSRNLQGMDASLSEMCKSIHELNGYLKKRKNDLIVGISGRYLHAVIGQDLGDVGSVVSTITYAYYLNETRRDSHLCTIAIINMKREDLTIHTELKWLLDSCHVDESSLIFIDEIDLSYYDLYGDLKLMSLKGNKRPTKQKGMKEALIEISNRTQDEAQYPWVEEVTMEQDCSCCALIAEKIAEASPEILAGRGFSRLLLSGILLDTGNLKDTNCSSKDKYMATLLINGAGRLGSNGLYQMLKYKMFDISNLKVRDILRKNFKKWSRVAGNPNGIGSRLTVSHIGMSSIGISVEQLLKKEDFAANEVIQFQDSERLRLLMVVSGYEDSQENFRREILVSTNTAELMRDFIHFFNTNGANLPLKTQDLSDLREAMWVFEVDDKTTSRRRIERLLEEFGSVLRKH